MFAEQYKWKLKRSKKTKTLDFHALSGYTILIQFDYIRI